jgi:lysophospholipase L1-like esterase
VGRASASRLALWAGLVVSVIVIIGGLYVTNVKAAQGSQEAANAVPVTYAPYVRPPYVAVLGDSYTGGSVMNQGSETWLNRIIPRLDIVRQSFAVGGTGFVNGGAGQDFASRVPALVASSPDIVIVQGGHNDGGAPQADVQAAAAKVLNDLTSGLPHAKFVVLGPIWPNGDVPAVVKGIDQDLKELAVQHGAVFVDPIADGWFTGQYGQLIGSDGTHPTGAGHVHIADIMTTVLKPLADEVRSTK